VQDLGLIVHFPRFECSVTCGVVCDPALTGRRRAVSATKAGAAEERMKMRGTRLHLTKNLWEFGISLVVVLTQILAVRE
jgi:hypothetical protein